MIPRVFHVREISNYSRYAMFVATMTDSSFWWYIFGNAFYNKKVALNYF